jgi:hypothetical protein
MRPEGRGAVRAPCIRGTAGPALVLLSSESHFHRRYLFSLFFAFIACWMGGRHVRAALRVQ